MLFGRKQQPVFEGRGETVQKSVYDEGISSSGISFHLWRLYHHTWLVCLFFPLVTLMQKPTPPWQGVLGVLTLLLFAASYTWFMWPHPASLRLSDRTWSSISLVLFLTLSLLIITLALIDSVSWLWLFIGMSAIAGLLLPMYRAFLVIILFTLLPLIIVIGSQKGMMEKDWWWLLALMLLVRGLGLDMIGIARMGSAIRELHVARRELARLAVVEERLRLSRELHDLLGQTLSLITLKSELAQQTVTEAPERCAQELAEIEQVARHTLREVREAVAGYRQPRLESEIEGAKHLLESAGIVYHCDPPPKGLPSPLNATLAWTIREGVTNVIRHSHAHYCSIHIIEKDGNVSVEVLNDGCRQESEQSRKRTGLGLVSLQERARLLGGAIEAGRYYLQDKEYFRVCMQLPLIPTQHKTLFQEEK